jgi:thiamine pyrophosphokinase
MMPPPQPKGQAPCSKLGHRVEWSMRFTIVTNGDFPQSLNRRILQWVHSSRVIAADGGLTYALSQNIQPELWVGDGDSVSQDDLGFFQKQGGRVIPLSRYKDQTDTEAALQKALDHGAQEILLLGGGGGRFDHLFANFFLFQKYHQLKLWVTPKEEMQVLAGITEIQLPKGAVVSFIPLETGTTVASSTGLEWPLESWDFHQGISLSNLTTQEKITIRLDSGRLLLVKPGQTNGITKD